MKKIAAAVCAFAMLFGIHAYATTESEASDEARKIVDYVNTLTDTPYAASACQMFVRTTFEKCLDVHNTEIICCATKAWEVYGVSDSKDIPTGAAVYFSGSSTVDSYCGRSAGHVGIYLGDGYIAHDWGAKIIKTTIEYVTDRGYTYLGWGWQGKHPLNESEIADKPSEEEKAAAEKPQVIAEIETEPEIPETVEEKNEEEPTVSSVTEEIQQPLLPMLEPGIKVSDTGL